MAEKDHELSRLEQFREIVHLDPMTISHTLAMAVRSMSAAILRRFWNLRAAIRLGPDYSAAFRDLGKALERSGAPAEAMQVYSQGIPIAERNGDCKPSKRCKCSSSG